jgi:hypothetical protein
VICPDGSGCMRRYVLSFTLTALLLGSRDFGLPIMVGDRDRGRWTVQKCVSVELARSG